MNISAVEWDNLSKLLDEALDLPEPEREVWIADLAKRDSHSAPFVRDLLSRQEDPSPSAFLQTLPPLENSLELGTPLGGVEEGSIIGPYRLLRELGHGGMGTVWLAERADGLVRRAIALKLPLPSVLSTGFLQQFDQERNILARLNHHHIARLYDAGISENRQPFIALEYVEGAPITRYCDLACFDIRARLELFLQVLRAVQHAHSQLVVHRDLKPSNILVTTEGEVKLLDFGVAMLLGDARNNQRTGFAGRALTPDYAAPEELQGQVTGIASDVYSLGVVAYELLSGIRPLRAGYREKCSGEYPSKAHITNAAAQHRSTSVKRLALMLRGDIDSIIEKALRYSPEERYATVNDFASDVERYLSGNAVSAHSGSPWYYIRKFVLRHKLAVAAAFSVCLLVAAAIAVTIWQAQAAKREARTAASVQTFLRDIFQANTVEQSDPVKARQTTARELLDIGASKVSNELQDSPDAKARVLSTLASMYQELGLDDRAVLLYQQAVELSKSVHGPQNTDAASLLVNLSGSMHASRFVNERERVLKEAEAILNHAGDYTSRNRGLLLSKLAEHYQSTDLDKAVVYAREAVGVFRRQPPSTELSEALYLDAVISLQRRECAGAERSIAEAIELSRQLDGNVNAGLPRFYAYQGEIQQKLCEFSRAEESFRKAWHIARQLNGENHVDTLQTEMRLGQFLFTTARPQEGLYHLIAARALALRLRGPSDPFYTPQALLSYGWALAQDGRLEEGLRDISSALANRRRNRPGTRYLAQMLVNQAYVLWNLGATQDAHKALAEAFLIQRTSHEKPDPTTSQLQAELLANDGSAIEAASVLESFPKPTGESPLSSDNLHALQMRAEAALLRGDPLAALRFAQQLLDQITSSSARSYLANFEGKAALCAGRALLSRHQPGEARPFLERALTIRTNLLDPISPDLADAKIALAKCQLELGHRPKSIALLREAKTIYAAHLCLGQQHTTLLRDLENRLAGRQGLEPR